MKKYNILMVASVAIYVVLAICLTCFVRVYEKNENHFYKVEINRIYNSLNGSRPTVPDVSYEYVERVDFLEESATREEWEGFFDVSGDIKIEIRPWFFEGRRTGFIRFEYRKTDVKSAYLMAGQIVLFCLEACIFILLLFLRKRLIRPFSVLRELPYELARGHFNAEVKEEKGKYMGDFMRSVGYLRDNLATTKKREFELLKEKKLMLLSLSHDIKTPLNTIKLYEKALEEDLYTTTEEKQHALQQIQKKTEEIERYVAKIMEASREDIIDIKVEQQDFYLKELIEKTVDVYEEKCKLRMLSLSIGEFDNHLLKGDLERAFEVIENIFENAFKYGDGRKIEITFEEQDYCQLIRIKNTGEPVSDNDLNHIFESFFRGENSRKKQGSGLGLFICREIMHKMGGEIFAVKREDGMEFVLVFS